MVLIEEYMKRSKDERQKHLNLNDACIERGGNSHQCRVLLAHVLDTSIPKGMKIHLCHACYNDKCNNPKHLYWGTASENHQDRMDSGDSTLWERTVAKYGEEGAREKYRQVQLGKKQPIEIVEKRVETWKRNRQNRRI